MDESELRGWKQIDIDDGLTNEERAELRRRQSSYRERLNPYRKDWNESLEQFAEENDYDMDDVRDSLDAESAFRETEHGKEIHSRLHEKRQEVEKSLIREYETFLEERFESPESVSKKDRICGLKRAFGTKARRHTIAKAADASPGYVGKFSVCDDITVENSRLVSTHYDNDAHEQGEPTVILQRERRRGHRDSGLLSSNTRQEIRNRDGNECLRCGSTENLEIHHIRPVTHGGGDEKDNLATLCADCHKEAILVGADKQVTAYPRGEFEAWLNDDLDICGARTRDNSRCQNPAGSCPHHG